MSEEEEIMIKQDRVSICPCCGGNLERTGEGGFGMPTYSCLDCQEDMIIEIHDSGGLYGTEVPVKKTPLVYCPFCGKILGFTQF